MQKLIFECKCIFEFKLLKVVNSGSLVRKFNEENSTTGVSSFRQKHLALIFYLS